MLRATPALLAALLVAAPAAAEVILEPAMRHLRIDGAREWSEFPESPEADAWEARFQAPANAAEWTLRLRQQDVKQTWTVTLNNRELGRLTVDENDMVIYFSVPPGLLEDAGNLLRIEQDLSRRAVPDDIRVGEIKLDERPRDAVLSEARLEVRVHGEDPNGPQPARLTIVDARGSLQTLGAASDDRLAVRAGAVFTADGRASFGLPAGEYAIYAGRGFEYSLAHQSVRLRAGESISIELGIRRQVPTEGWVACDPHVHTFTYSGHGDAALDERLITLAAEGVELPVATDHNQHIDYAARARELGLGRYFTPVIGNEVTTPSAHFNIFPVVEGAPAADHRSPEWSETLDNIFRTPGVKVAILNHARDLHSGVRPFDPELFNAAVGESRAERRMGFNAMEVVNSGATQTDPLELAHDWMSLLNRGLQVTPVGSSDSHDVARHFVGQGRTYIRAGDSAPGAIDVEQTVAAFLQGRVMVSYGLLAQITVEGRYGPGELARLGGDEVRVDVRVLGPDWVSADEVLLYADGEVVRREAIRGRAGAGVLWSGGWTLSRPRHDVHLVAVALGPGVEEPYWRTAKAYQPDSPDWRSHVIGVSGAVWLDGDADGRRMAAYDYARSAVAEGGDVWGRLGAYDAAVAAQAANLLTQRGVDLTTDASWRDAGEAVRAGVERYLEALQPAR